MKVLNILLEITVYSAVIFAVIVPFKKLLNKKISPALHLAVWLLLILRLLLPVTFDASMHFIRVPGETLQIDSQSEDVLPNESAEELQAETEGNSQPAAPESAMLAHAPQAHDDRALDTPVFSNQPATIEWESVLVAIWIAGIVACAGITILGYFRLLRNLRRNAVPTPKALEALFDECRNDLNISGRVQLSVQRFVQSPALLFPSMVLLPVNILDTDREKIRLALIHELTHDKRKDQLFAMLLLALRVVYWFNPVMHIAERMIRDDIETACDSRVVRSLSAAEKGVYARSLISMYQSASETQMVLGMALCGTRKNAEKRIRGIYKKHKSQWHVKLTAMLLAGVLAVCCFTTACQPTPETPPVIHKVEDIPKEAILETETPTAVVKNTVEPAAYSVKGHWTETAEMNEFLSIEADADILMPEAEVYPAERLERVVLTQDKANELIAYFTEPGTKFYSGENVKLKSDYEDELIDLKQSLQNVLNGGDGETPESIRGYIKEVEKKLVKAPETHTYTYVEPLFTYRPNYETGEPRKQYGENSIFVSIELPDGGRYGSVDATRYEKDKSTSSGFYYKSFSGGWNLESSLALYDEQLKEEMEDPRYLETTDNTWKSDMTRQREFVDAGLKSMETNHMDLRAAADKAVLLLEDLGIEDMQLKSYEKAMFSRERSQEEEYTIPACYVEFVRECGGIPSLSQDGGSFSYEQDYSEVYCAPFGLERINVLISEEGIESFSWRNMAQVVESVAKDTALMPLDEVKQRILDQIYFMNAAWLENAPQYGKKRYKIGEMRLVTTYINAKDDPERVLIVPAWHITTQEEDWYDQTAEWSQGNKEEFMVNAIDGSGILRPCTLELMENRGEGAS